MSGPSPANRTQAHAPAQQQANHVNNNAPKLPILQTLSFGSNSVNACLEHDKTWPELGDLLSRMDNLQQFSISFTDLGIEGSSTEYIWQSSPAWRPFFRSEVVNIPDEIFEQYNSTECFTQMGLFGEIQRAWITVDNRLYLWNYANGQDFQAYEDHAHTITCVKLVRPRPGVFVEGITHILVIATLYEVFLLGVSAPRGHSGELQFYGTRMSVPATGIEVSCIESTATGRIFFAGKVDTHLYELLYQAEEGWFSRRCSKVNHTGSTLDNFLPATFGSKSAEKIVQIAIDDSRKVLYTLSSKSTIRAYSLSNESALNLNVTYTYASAASHAQMLNAASPLIDPRTTSLVSISVISLSESKQMYLVATNSTGCRLYMRSSNSSFYNPQSSAMSSLQVSHVRFPPVAPQTVQGNNKTTVNVLVQAIPGQMQNNASQVLHDTASARSFAPGHFFAIKRATGPEPGDSLFSSAPELNRIALQTSNGNTRPLLNESCCWVTIEGFVQDVCRIGDTGLGLAGIGSELTTQFTTQPSTFAVLTNTGVHLIRRRRTVEVLASAIRHSPSTSGGIEVEMTRFFENMGRAEGCATCLGVICGSLDGSDVDSETMTAFNATYGSKLSSSEVQETSRKYFIEFGGKAFVDENQNRNFSRDGSATAPTIDMIKLSGRHDGIALYMSRLVVSFWKSPVFKQVSGAPQRRIDYVSGLPASYLKVVQSRIVALQQFLETNKNFIEGLSGPDRLAHVANRIEEIVLQAEHRGMHSLMTLISQIVEGLSFIQVLCDTPDQKMTDVMLSLPPQILPEAQQMTFEQLITTDRGRDVAKELITTVINRRIAQGGTVESVSETLQKRCGSFCSADDVILYKAIEKLKRAKESTTVGERDNMLRECLQLFEHAASTLSIENLEDTMEEFSSMQFYSGALTLAFSVARAADPYNVSLAFFADGKPENDARDPIYQKRARCYVCIFEALERLEQAFSAQQAAYVANPTAGPLDSVREKAYQVINESQDELFHYLFYDWYRSRGLQNRLLDIQSPFIQLYLERKASESIDMANLLWEFHAKNSSYLDAAQVLYDLSRSNFEIPLESRIENLSQANSFCACVPVAPHVAALHQNILEELDVAGIQDDIMNEIKVDTRLAEPKRAELIKRLNGKLVPLTDLFNKFADPLSYGSICLSIFQSADYRGALEIRNCWEKLIDTEHEKAENSGDRAPYETIAQLIKTLGRRFSKFENVFPVDDLLPMLETYSLTKQRKSPRGWVIDAFLAAGIPHDILFSVLDGMYEHPSWQGRTATTVLCAETIHLSNLWFEISLRPAATRFYINFNKNAVLAALDRYANLLRQQQGSGTSELRIELETLEARIKSDI